MRFTLNGKRADVRAHPMARLLDVLREDCRLTGTKEGCGEGECGACTVLLNGRAVTSCLVLAAEVAGGEVVTIEGLAAEGTLDRLQQAFLANGAVQCGFCIPGMIMSARYLLMTNPSPTIAEIKEGLVGNLCRCGGYSRIVASVAEAAGTRR